MQSTWMDPLLKAQHTSSRSRAAGAMLQAADPRQGVLPDTPEPDEYFPVLRKPRPGHRDREPWTADAADWGQGLVDILPDMEREVGIADWIDPQTGAPAEGLSPPRIESE
ncbi:MAG: hypothetical protein V4858_00225 [Pseudomonadota bacterium]